MSQQENQEVQAAPVDAPKAPARTPRRMHPLAIVVGIIVVLLVVGFVVYIYLRTTHSGPLAAEVYPGALLLNKSITSTNSDSAVYTTKDPIDSVLAFYFQHYGQAYYPTLPGGEIDEANAKDNGCLKVYTESKPSEEPGHYFGRCIIEDPFGDLTRTLQISIDYQNNSDNGPQTVIRIDRIWGGG
jgi:hypothetical protein